MAAFRYSLLISFGLLPAALCAQSIAPQSVGSPGFSSAGPSTHHKSQLLDSTPGATTPRTPADSLAHRYPPAYPGGDAQLVHDLQRNVRYPAAALRAAAEGKVFVSFTIETDGTVADVRIVKSASPLLNEGVVQAVKTLRGFTPARQDGQPMRSTATFPVSFHIVGTTKYPVRVVQAPVRGPVQPQATPRAGNQVVQKLASLQDSSYRRDSGHLVVVVNRHYFTYDQLGRPATHTQEYRAGGPLLAYQVFRYEYSPDGKLAAKVSDHLKYVFHYAPNGQLSGIMGYNRVQQQWAVYEETKLTEKARQPDGSRLVALVVHHVPAGTSANDIVIDYLLAADNSVIKSTNYRRGAQVVTRPFECTFAYDKQVNPLGDLFAENWYRFEVGQSGAHNLVHALTNGKEWKSMTYTYNEAGLPTRGIRRERTQVPYQTQLFTYADIVVPTPLRLAEAASSVAIYPNPAASTTIVKAASIGPGPATLRLRSTTTGEVRRQTEYQVATTFQETIAVAGLEKGPYVVEISSGPTVVTGRLLVE